MLGVLGIESYRATEVEVRVARGDDILAYTDGATEAVSSNDEMLGLDGVERLFQSAERGAPTSVINSVREGLEAYRHGIAQDDTLLVVARLT